MYRSIVEAILIVVILLSQGKSTKVRVLNLTAVKEHPVHPLVVILLSQGKSTKEFEVQMRKILESNSIRS